LTERRKKYLSVTPEPCHQLEGKRTVSHHTQLFRNGERGYLEKITNFLPKSSHDKLVSHLHRSKKATLHPEKQHKGNR